MRDTIALCLLLVVTQLAVLLLPSCALTPALAKSENIQKQWKGYLIDRLCMKAARGFTDPTEFVKSHTRDCIRMSRCQESGFALLSGGNWYLLDKKGDAMVRKLIGARQRTTGKQDGLNVLVKGRKDERGTIIVSEIRIVKAEAHAHRKDSDRTTEEKPEN